MGTALDPPVAYKYPYLVCVITSVWDESLASKCRALFLEKYAAYSPEVQIVHSRGGIREAFKSALDLSEGKPVLIVDADFKADGSPSLMRILRGQEIIYTHVWQVTNPLNGLVYGHGGPKLVCSPYFDLSVSGPDVTLASTTQGMTVYPGSVGVHGFNYSELSVFRTTLREAYKLRRSAEKGNTEARGRLAVWTTSVPTGENKKFHWAYDLGLLTAKHTPVSDNSNAFINNYSTLTKIGFQYGFH